MAKQKEYTFQGTGSSVSIECQRIANTHAKAIYLMQQAELVARAIKDSNPDDVDIIGLSDILITAASQFRKAAGL